MEDLFDIERSIANNRLSFLPSAVRRKFNTNFSITLVGLLGSGAFAATLAYNNLLQRHFVNEANWFFMGMIVIGILLIFFGLEYAYAILKLRVLDGTNDSNLNFDAIQLALKKSDYIISEKSNRTIYANKHIRFERKELHFHGFVHKNKIYFVIYKTGKGIAFLTSIFKPINVIEFEEFFAHAIKVVQKN